MNGDDIMTWFLIIVLIIVLLIIYMYFEAIWLKVDRISFSKSSKGLKVLHISDIHINMFRINAEKIREIIRNENPDVLVFTGDYIEKPVNASQFLDLLQRIKLNNKTYLCLGNHDYRAYANNPAGLGNFIKEINALQVEVLVNSSVCIEKNHFKYNIIGIDDLRGGNPDIEKAIAGCSPSATNIVITHNPDIALQLNRSQADYLFCGHFHGGQIWMPFNLEFFLLRKDVLCKKGKRRGLHKINGMNVYINRGLGTVVFPFRFMSRPEITVYNIP
jgi:Predicted phosphohydrolases